SADGCPGAGRADRESVAQGTRFAAGHGADAGRNSCGNAGDWKSRGDQCSAAGRGDFGEFAAGAQGETAGVSGRAGGESFERDAAVIEPRMGRKTIAHGASRGSTKRASSSPVGA